MTQTILWPGTTVIGAGTLSQLSDQAATLGVTHLFALIDPGIPGLPDKIKAAAGDLKLTISTGVVQNPDAASTCLLYTSPSPRDLSTSRMPSSA